MTAESVEENGRSFRLGFSKGRREENTNKADPGGHEILK